MPRFPRLHEDGHELDSIEVVIVTVVTDSPTVVVAWGGGLPVLPV